MTTWIGVDVSKRRLDLFVDGETRNRSFEQPAELDKIEQFISNYPDAQVVLESTGGYERALVEALGNKSIACTIVNPARARAFMNSVGSLAKTDAIDAQLLARMGSALQLAPSAPVPRVQRELEALVRRRTQLVEQEVLECNHAEHAGSKSVQESVARMRKLLKQEISAIGVEIEQLIRETPELHEKSRRLQSVPGVGPVVATGLLVSLPELGRLSKPEVAALAGLAPYNADSGARSGKRTIRAGRSPVRTLLYMAALVASRHNPILSHVYKRLIAAGKPKKLALIAIARKLVVILNSLLKNKKDWNLSQPCNEA